MKREQESPATALSGCSAPVMILMSVDLPAPFSPTSAWTSPARRSNETPLSARTAPNVLVIESTLRSIDLPIRLAGSAPALEYGSQVPRSKGYADFRDNFQYAAH